MRLWRLSHTVRLKAVTLCKCLLYLSSGYHVCLYLLSWPGKNICLTVSTPCPDNSSLHCCSNNILKVITMLVRVPSHPWLSLAFVTLKCNSFCLSVTHSCLALQPQTLCPSFFQHSMLVHTSLISHHWALSAQKTGFREFPEPVRSGCGL